MGAHVVVPGDVYKPLTFELPHGAGIQIWMEPETAVAWISLDVGDLTLPEPWSAQDAADTETSMSRCRVGCVSRSTR